MGCHPEDRNRRFSGRERDVTDPAGWHPALILLTVAVLSTLFSLFMSDVGAIVVLANQPVG
jgi:hypothetical protein